MLFGVLIITLILVVISGVIVPMGALGKFEISKRQTKDKDLEVDRELYYQDVISLQHGLQAILVVVIAAVSIGALGWIIGILVACLIALQYKVIARRSYIRSFSTKQYRKIEPKILEFIRKYIGIFKYIRVFTPEIPEVQLHSKDELIHVINESAGVISSQEKAHILSSLSFSETRVSEVMTPRSMIDSINRVEILGPLVLDDLHTRGHSRYPVIETDVDHVVGTLYVREAIQLSRHKHGTAKVEEVMESRVLYINEHQSLQHALAAFIRTHHHLFVVVNKYRETVGLLTLEDTIEALIGEKIVDEFDEHDDLRTVASRKPRANTTAETFETI